MQCLPDQSMSSEVIFLVWFLWTLAILSELKTSSVTGTLMPPTRYPLCEHARSTVQRKKEGEEKGKRGKKVIGK